MEEETSRGTKDIMNCNEAYNLGHYYQTLQNILSTALPFAPTGT